MISLNNVTKIYTSKAKEQVVALKNVSFQLDNSGMVFILGKSGSGKSTLLNLIGGLDQPTEGAITVDGISMKDFKQGDYDGYRNGYVGFIFQEYNLLDDFNVKDNIAIALRLSKDATPDNKVIDALKRVELTEDYLTRRVGELSGGEKQRIAIARSIVKDSKLILADEPTGNLDSATGESIWNILKNLSKDKLVVVVSHDRESAEKYADRIIEISDGSVISDNGVQKDSAPVDTFSPQKMRLSFSDCFKMAFNSLFKRKFRAISIMLISILTTLALVFAQMMLSYNPLKTDISFVKQHDVPYVSVRQQTPNEEGELVPGIFKGDSLQYIAQNSTYIVGNIVESKQQVLDFGFTFIGDALELDSNSFYITERALKSRVIYAHSDDYILVDGRKEPLKNYSGPIESLVGKQIYTTVNDESQDNLPILAGIIETSSLSKHINGSDFFPSVFSRSDFAHRFIFPRLDINWYSDEITLDVGGNTFNSLFNVDHRDIDGRILIRETDYIWKYDQIREIQLADDEIILTYELYAQLFSDAKSKYYYIEEVPYHREEDGTTTIDQHYEAVATPEHIGETVPIKLFDSEGNVILDLGDKKLVGVTFSNFVYNDDYAYINNCYVYTSYGNFAKIALAVKQQTIYVKVDSVKSLSRFLTTLNNKYNVTIGSVGEVYYEDGINSRGVAVEAYWFVDTANRAVMIFSIVGLLLLVVLILLVINLISFSISARRKEIGILSALGTSKSDIIKIFIFEALFISIVSFVVTLLCAIPIVNPINHSFYNYLVDTIPFLRVSVLTVAVVTFATFGLLLLAAWIPIRKLAKLKPVDAIREV